MASEPGKMYLWKLLQKLMIIKTYLVKSMGEVLMVFSGTTLFEVVDLECFCSDTTTYGLSYAKCLAKVK